MTLTFSTGSGYLNSPPRVVMIDNDNRPGSYPSHVSPIDIRRSQGSDGTRPYRDIVIPAAVSPYAKATLRFITRLPAIDSTITLTNTNAGTSTFRFKNNPPTFNPSPGVYDINMAGIWVGSTDTAPTSIEAARLISLKFIEAVSRATDGLITAAPSPTPGEVFLTQTVPGTAGNTAISTTVSALRLEVENFAGGSDSTQIRYPYGQVVDDSDSSTSEVIRRVIKSSRSGTLSAPGTPNPQMLIGPSDQHPYVNYSPFDESGTQQSFGLPGGSEAYGTQVQLYDDFFTRGSTLGPLDEPLWVKDKIEIDLTPTGETSLLATTGSATSGPASNFPMAYFSFNTRRWEPIGFGYGRTTPAGATTLQENLERQYLGFSQGWGNLAIDSNTAAAGLEILDSQLRDEYTGTKKVFQDTGWCTPIDAYGFPLHPKYHATGSQQLDVSEIINRPFLVESIVYEFSASMPNTQSRIFPVPLISPDAVEYRGGAGTFFILNQRKSNPDPGQENSYTNVYVSQALPSMTVLDFGTPQEGGTNGLSGDYYELPYQNGGIPRTMQLSTSGPSVYVDTTRDLVTFARMGTVWDTYGKEIDQLIEPGFPHPASFMDLAIEVPASGTFSGKYTIAAPVRAPSQNSAVAKIDLGAGVSPDGIIAIWASKDSSTRNSIDIATGRAYGNEFFGPETSYRVKGYVTSKRLFAPKKDSAPSPYLIMPGDKLIFGWQSPTYYTVAASQLQTSGTLKILPGAGKLTLYGSYLQDDKPVHNIYKDQLNSDAAHEAIPAGPWVLDRFESEPQMMYSSSMREEHVTGTMVTRGADGSLVVTDVNDLGIGGVRAISAKASDGNLGQRWSFFRNNRLFDSDEQYYDSMQPNPLDVLFTYGGGDKRAYGTAAGAFSLISIPGEVYVGDPIAAVYNSELNSIKNINFVGSFPFGEKYPNVSRVKSINSKLLSSQLIVSLAIGGNAFKNLIGVGFITGSASGNGTLSNLVRDGGLFRRAPSILTSSADFIFIKTSREDTNPVSGASRYLADNVDSDGVNYHLSRFMGCFGSGYMQLIQYGNLAPTYPTDGSINQMFYRGVKHGLINPTPLFSSAVFNGTQFGQLRDMLEQRQYTRFSLNDNTLTDSAIYVQFINRGATPGTLNIVSGSFTNSSNISKFATSEHPYDDGRADYDLIWDRDTPLPETLIAL